MDLYAENILDHYKHPRHKGPLPDATVSHKEENASCGDDLTLHLQVKNNRVEKISWEGNGCAISQAGMSLMTEEWEGKSVSELESISQDDVKNTLGVEIGPRRFKCALLCLHTRKNTLRKISGAEPQSWRETVQIEN